MFNSTRTPRSYIAQRALQRKHRYNTRVYTPPKQPAQPFQPVSRLPMTPVAPKGPGYDS